MMPYKSPDFFPSKTLSTSHSGPSCFIPRYTFKTSGKLSTIKSSIQWKSSYLT